MPTNTMKIRPDIGTILSNLVAQDVSGAMKDYAVARINGQPVAPELAKAAYMDAKKLIDAAQASGDSEVSLGGSKSLSVVTLEGLLADIQDFAKVAAARESIQKLASKFEKLIK